MGATGSTDKIVAQYYNARVQKRIVASHSEFSWMLGGQPFGILAEFNPARWSVWASAADTIESLEKFQDNNTSNRQGSKPIILRRKLTSVPPVLSGLPTGLSENCCGPLRTKNGIQVVPKAAYQKLVRSIRDAVCTVTVSAVLEISLKEAENKLQEMLVGGRTELTAEELNVFLEAECGMPPSLQRAISAEDAARAPFEHKPAIIHCPNDPRSTVAELAAPPPIEARVPVDEEWTYTLDIGKCLEAQHSSGHWYSAQIVGWRLATYTWDGDGIFTVRWDDGHTQDTSKRVEQLRPLGSGSLGPPRTGAQSESAEGTVEPQEEPAANSDRLDELLERKNNLMSSGDCAFRHKLPAQAIIHCPNDRRKHTLPAQAIIHCQK